MTSIVATEGRGVTGPDGGLQIVAPGISLPFADGRYIKRFVGGVLAGDTYLGDNSAGSGQEVVLASPNGPFMAGVASDISPSLLIAGDGARFTPRVRVIRFGATPNFIGIRPGGTPSAPTQSLTNYVMVGLTGSAWSDAGTEVTAGVIQLALREAVTPTSVGSAWAVQAVDLGSSTNKTIITFRGGGAGVAEIAGVQTITRFIPVSGGTMRLRNASNTADLLEVGSGLGFFGTANIAKPTVTGSRGGNAALASALTQLAALGLITDSSTA